MKIISKWKFNTSATGSVGYAIISLSGGLIRLTKPGSDDDNVDFKYRGIGGGISYGLKMPQGTFAPTDFTSVGAVFRMPRCSGPELEESDFLGPCMYADLGAGFIAGGGATIMFLGLPSSSPPSLALVPFVAKACIPMAGYSLMKQASAGVTISMGFVYK
jgi:hypothetical protein